MVRNFDKNSEGVSAVIGVILMVAITVILAAVIAAFVFSMSGNVSKPYTVGITIKKTANGDIMITNNGGPDVPSLKYVNVTFQPKDATTSYYACTDGDNADSAKTNPWKNLITVGGSYTIPKNSFGDGTATGKLPAPETPTHIIVVGYFQDGKTQVIGEADV